MGNAEATRPAAGESVEAIRRGSDEPEHSHADCGTARQPASTKVINTPHEVMFHQALTRARLSFETQSHPAGDRYEADIELLQKPIVIEVTNSPGEKRAAGRRERKTAALEAAGYRVYWFSNHQARTNPDAAVQRVMRENGLRQEEAPTVLIRPNRTGHAGQLNPNWGGGPAAAVCEQCGSLSHPGAAMAAGSPASATRSATGSGCTSIRRQSTTSALCPRCPILRIGTARECPRSRWLTPTA